MWPFKRKHWIEKERQFLMRDNSQTGVGILFGSPPNYGAPPSPVTLITYYRDDNHTIYKQIVLDGHIKKE